MSGSREHPLIPEPLPQVTRDATFIPDIPAPLAEPTPPFTFIPEPVPEPTRWWLHLALFAATVVTTMGAGAMLAGGDILADPAQIWKGIPFAAALLLILGVHESAHYVASRSWGLPVTPPYFIPAPTLIGTMGAVIRIKAPISRRAALLDVGVSGPLAGFVVALPITLLGLRLSTVQAIPEGEQGFRLGSSLLFELLAKLAGPTPGPGMDLMLHPVAFAGWVGLLVTALNLLPVGQLDGGHVVRALFGGRFHTRVALATLVILLPLGWFWPGWLIWAVLLLVIGWRHPPVWDDELPLDRRRLILGWTAVAVFVLTFTPVPFME